MSTIKTIAHPNELTKEVKNDYYLLHQPIGTLYSKDVIARMERKQIATNNVNGAAFVAKFNEECILAVSEGYNVITDLCRISLSITGAVYSQDLGHNVPADKADVKMSFTQGTEARNAVKNITLQIAEQPAPSGPVIQIVTNPIVNEPNTLNVGAMVLIQGLRIAIKGEKIDEIGVFFTSAGDGTVVRVAPSQLSPNMPSKLQFILPPEITPGEWFVSMVTQTGNNSKVMTEKSRRYDYSEIITVI